MFRTVIAVLLLLRKISMALPDQYLKSATFTFPGDSLPTGLVASKYIVKDAPKEHEFVPQNAYVQGGYLNLLVNGGQQHDEVVWCGEVSTTFTVESASVETYAILSAEPGVCNAMFMYESDSQEVDIEWLSDPKSKANIQAGFQRALYYTNQAVEPNHTATEKAGAGPSDATHTVHNYRIDWNSTSTSFYIDGELQYKFEKNVPTTKKGYWVWNNWSNGDKQWSAGPPAKDALFKIQKIVMHYNPGSS